MSQTEKKQEEMSRDFAVIDGRRSDQIQSQKYAGENEIDLVDLAYALLDKIHYIVFFALLGAVLLNAYSYFRIRPTYVSTAKMYIVSASGDTVVDLTDLNIGMSLTTDYEQLMLSYPVLDQVIEELESFESYKRLDQGLTSSSLASMITISNPDNTRILEVKATTTDPELSRDIANTMVAVSLDYLPKTMGTTQPNIAQEARAAVHKTAPSYIKYTVMGALLGIIMCCMYFTIKYLMDDRIRTADDMEKYFGMVPLTTIPDFDSLKEKNEKPVDKKAKGV